MCIRDSVQANNEYLDNYNPEQESNYRMYWDAHNLYGWAMSQPLPYEDLNFEKNIIPNNILETSDNNYVGHYVGCDLSYPEELHDKFKEYPPCPQNLTPDITWFSDFQQEVCKKVWMTNRETYSGTNKLFPHEFEHKKYVLHYRNHEFIHNLGVNIDKLHRVISFKQEPWLKKYLDFNTNTRKEAHNESEK